MNAPNKQFKNSYNRSLMGFNRWMVSVDGYLPFSISSILNNYESNDFKILLRLIDAYIHVVDVTQFHSCHNTSLCCYLGFTAGIKNQSWVGVGCIALALAHCLKTSQFCVVASVVHWFLVAQDPVRYLNAQ